METKRKLPMEWVRVGDVDMDRRSKRKRKLPMELVSAGDAGVDRTWIRKRKLPMELVGAGDAEVDRTWKRNASCRWSWSALAMRRGKRCRFGGKVTGSVMDRENE